MLELNPRQREVLAEKLPDVANLAAGALVFGQFLNERPLSLRVALVGVGVWLFLMALSMFVAAGR